MTIAKKTILSVATLGLSLGIIGTASANDISTPTPTIQNNSIIEVTSSITPYNIQKPYSERTYFSKTEYLIPMLIPETKSVQIPDAAGVWTGRLTKGTVTESDSKNGWWVVYSGTLTLY